MTTWYREVPDVDDEATWAFSVRPDLWPPGSHCWAYAGRLATLADWALDWTLVLDHVQVDEANGLPGAGEALILAGQVLHGAPWDKSAAAILGETRPAWTEIPDPRGSP